MNTSAVKKILDTQTTWLLFGLCWLVYFSSYIGRLNFSAAMPDMIDGGRFNLTQAGSVNTAFFMCYAAGQWVSGLLGDRFKAQHLVFMGVGLSALANLAMPFSPGYAFTLLAWAVNGAALSMLWPPIVRIFADMLDEGSMIKCCVHITSSMAAGNLCAYLLSAALIKRFDWRAVFLGAACLLLTLAFVWRIGFRRIERRREKYGVTETVAAKVAGFTEKQSAFRMLFVSGTLLLLVPVAVHGAFKDGITAWIPTMLTQSFAVSSSAAVLVSAAVPVVNLAGAYMASAVHKKWIKSESLAAALFFLAMLAALVGLRCFGSVSLYLSAALLSVVTASTLAVNTLLISFLPLRFRRMGRTATVSGFFNAVAYLGSAGTTAGIGAVASGFGWDTAMNGLAALAVLACGCCVIGYALEKRKGFAPKAV